MHYIVHAIDFITSIYYASSIEKLFLKELCLLSFKGCAPGLYGNNCAATCPPNCRDGICDNIDGRCVDGCKDGYVKSDSCEDGTYLL